MFDYKQVFKNRLLAFGKIILKTYLKESNTIEV